MIGLVFTFEGLQRSETLLFDQHTAKRVLDAVSVAANCDDFVTYEELTDITANSPVVAVMFAHVTQVDPFIARLTDALNPYDIWIRHVRPIKDWKAENPAFTDAAGDNCLSVDFGPAAAVLEPADETAPAPPLPKPV